MAGARGKGRVGRGLSEAAEALLGMGVEADDEEATVTQSYPADGNPCSTWLRCEAGMRCASSLEGSNGASVVTAVTAV